MSDNNSVVYECANVEDAVFWLVKRNGLLG